MCPLPSDPFAMTIAQATAALRDRLLSPSELMDSVLQRFSATEDRVHAYAAVAHGQAAEAARQATQEISSGHWKGPLHGIPVALKDVYHVAGLPTEAGSDVLKGFVPTEDSEVAARLKSAGAIILGKTVTTEFAYYAFRRDTPQTRNPWNPDFEPGDSSAGSAAAVAVRSAFAAMGTDSGGSIRKPASMCGVVGLKPTYGRVSQRGVIPLSSTMDHCGPLTRSVEDSALVLNAIAGVDGRDPTSLDEPVGDVACALGQGVRGLKLGVDEKHFLSGADPIVCAAFESALNVLRSLGATVVPVAIPDLDTAMTAGSTILSADAAYWHQKWLRDNPQSYQTDTRIRLQLGQFILATDYLRAMSVRREFARKVRTIFEGSGIHAFVAPTQPRPAQPLSHMDDAPDAEAKHAMARKWNWYCMPFNLTGQPALSVPCGFTAEGLPLGMQIVGRPLDEAMVLRIGHAYEAATDWHERLPLS